MFINNVNGFDINFKSEDGRSDLSSPSVFRRFDTCFSAGTELPFFKGAARLAGEVRGRVTIKVSFRAYTIMTLFINLAGSLTLNHLNFLITIFEEVFLLMFDLLLTTERPISKGTFINRFAPLVRALLVTNYDRSWWLNV